MSTIDRSSNVELYQTHCPVYQLTRYAERETDSTQKNTKNKKSIIDISEPYRHSRLNIDSLT